MFQRFILKLGLWWFCWENANKFVQWDFRAFASYIPSSNFKTSKTGKKKKNL